MTLVLDIAGTPYSWIVDASLPTIEFSSFASVLTVIIGCLASGSVSLIVLILTIIVAWNYIKLLFEAAERYIMVVFLSTPRQWPLQPVRLRVHPMYSAHGAECWAASCSC